MIKKWNPEEIRKQYSREELIRYLQGEWNMRLPWERDEAVFYAKTVYPDITEKDFN